MVSPAGLRRRAGRLLVGVDLVLLACGPVAEETNRRVNARGAIGLNDKCGGSGLLLTDSVPSEELSLLDGEVGLSLSSRLPIGVAWRRLGADWTANAIHGDYSLEIDGNFLCDETPIRAHRVGDRTIIDLSSEAENLLKLTSVREATLSWPEPEAAAVRAAKELGAKGSPSVASARRCITTAAGTVVAAFDMRLKIDGFPYHVIGDEQAVKRMERVGFEVTGTSRTYDTGPVGGKLIDVTLPDLAAGTDGLQGPRFSMVNDDSTQQARNAERKYIYAADDPRFAETSLYTHAELQAAFYKKNDGVIEHCLPLVIHAHAILKVHETETRNNAQYVPAPYNDNGLPRIDIGDGDGVDLRNLALDFDVIAHEMGHHVLYRKVTSQQDESGVLHEGFADALVYANTENACLGESICPEGGGCYMDGKCLRTADNDLKYGDPDLPDLPHLRSMFLSGMLWDLGKQIGHKVVGKTILATVDYLQSRSGYTDFIKGMMAADRELSGGKNACMIFQTAVARGLKEKIVALRCEDYQ